MKSDVYKAPLKVIRLWKHECERVFRDRLVSQSDLDRYDEFLIATLKSSFKEEPMDQIQAAPNLFTSFIDATADGAPLYNQVIFLSH
jgi:dynein heavy chain, axonemal